MKARHLSRITNVVLFLFFSQIALLNNAFSQTVTKTYTAPSSVSIDGCGTYCSALPGVTFTAADFPSGCSITDVNVNVVWAKTDGTCTAPGTGNSFHAESNFRIDGPMGINEILVQPNTYSGNGSTSATSTTFDQSAATMIGGVDPVSGTFRPNNGNLNNFNGTSGIGTWYLRMGDLNVGDPLCFVSYSVTVTMSNTLDNASFSYGSGSYCVNAADPTPMITGQAGGTFSSTAGLAINATTGVIDVSASTPGTYSVTYTTPAPCSNSSSVSVTIIGLDNANFSYGASSYCTNGTDPTPTITGLPGGTFSSTAGLSLNAATGTIDVSASTPGVYSVNYVTNGTCPNGTVVPITINPADNASFSYASSSYCVNATDPTPTITGQTGGIFTSSAGLAINPSNGTIDVSASTPGTYSVSYTTPMPCSSTSNVSVTINALDNAGFNYTAASYCVNASDPTPTITGVVGGVFSSTAGLSINAATGTIDVSASTPGTYTVTYTTAGICPNSSTASISINALDNAGFNYAAASYCVNASDPTPTITGVVGGAFSSTAGLSINAATGTIDVSASTPGTYTVTYATAGICPNSSSASVTINALDNAGFSYSAAAYCVNASDPTPTITGVNGGTFSSTAGLVINAMTGAIDVSASTPGTYTVTYTTAGICPNSSTASVTINALDNAGFSYSAAAYCVNASDPTPTITGVNGGTFSSTAGLIINAMTGAIDVSASTPGTYTVTYTTAGICPNSSTASVTINALDNAGFNYASAAYCVNASDPTPTITGVAGGAFSSTAGLVINAMTGTIDLSASTPGTYTVTYTTAGTCPNSSTASVTINALDNAGFNYASAAYCVNASDPTPTITGVNGGTFSSTAGLVINATTGAIDVSASTPGTYTVTYTTAGTCPNSSTASVTINALDNAGFNYTFATYCVNASDPTPTITGANGGTFTSTAGLVINAITGAIDVSASTPGIYTVTYTTAGTCSNSSTASVTINNISTGTDTQVACDSYTWINGNTYTASNSSATYTLMNAAGCDSIVTLNLTLNYSSSSTITELSCGAYTSPGGNVYTTSGTYTEVLTTGAGCDSTLIINLTVETVDVAVNVVDVTMTANYSGGTYQWIDCATMSPIVGATGQSFTPVLNGDYAVIVSTGNCSDTSVCTTINSIKLDEFELSRLITLFPNPASDNLVSIAYDGTISRIDIVDLTGRVLQEGLPIVNDKIDVSSLSYGKYLIKITTESGVITKELIIAR